jgi:hypothetical protein
VGFDLISGSLILGHFFAVEPVLTVAGSTVVVPPTVEVSAAVVPSVEAAGDDGSTAVGVAFGL